MVDGVVDGVVRQSLAQEQKQLDEQQALKEADNRSSDSIHPAKQKEARKRPYTARHDDDRSPDNKEHHHIRDDRQPASAGSDMREIVPDVGVLQPGDAQGGHGAKD